MVQVKVTQNAQLIAQRAGLNLRSLNQGQRTRLDTNKNEQIDGSEAESAVGLADADGDGFVSRGERRKLKRFLNDGRRRRGGQGAPQGDASLALEANTHRRSATLGGTSTNLSARDIGAGSALDRLPKQGGDLGGDFERAIKDGTVDRDGQAAGREFADIRDYAEKNWDRLSPDAREKYRAYRDHAQETREEGKVGMDDTRYDNMKRDVEKAGYKDDSAGRAIEGSRDRTKGGPIDGDEMTRTIKEATQDRDNQAAGNEYDDLKRYADDNWDRMTPKAKERFETYERYAKDAQGRGDTGIDNDQYDKMLSEIGGKKPSKYEDQSAGRALERLPKEGQISGRQFERAIVDGTKDRDDQAAGAEYRDIKKYADDNWDRLSPNAREKFRTYEKEVKRSQANGDTGIPNHRYEAMKKDLSKAGYKDASSARAIETLKDKKGPITADDMSEAIIGGTRDLDSQAAGREYADLKKFYKENEHRMTPEAKERFGVYEKYVTKAQDRGNTGIDTGSYDEMVKEMRATGYKDAGAGRAIEDLQARTRGQEISGDDMRQTIERGTRDKDSSAASTEYQDLKRFADENWDRMSPDARQAFRTYEKAAKSARARGHQGIPSGEYKQMLKDMKSSRYQDAGAGRAIEALEDKTKGGPIQADDMRTAILDATKDKDSNAAAGEYRDLKRYAQDNWHRMTPDAREQFRTYERYARSAEARGKTGIPTAEYEQMRNELHRSGYKDASAARALENLESKPGVISGDDMREGIIDATKDRDNNAAAGELQDLRRFASRNWHRMSPSARQAFREYELTAMSAATRGMTGIPSHEYDSMVRRMKSSGYRDASTASAIERNINQKPGILTGDDIQRAILEGTSDKDNQAAGREFLDLQQAVHANWHRMSPDAKARWQTYERYARSAQGRGLTGIPSNEYERLKAELQTPRYLDQGAGRVIEGLNARPGMIDANTMIRAIRRGTADRDGQAAGAEFADFFRFAQENWHRLTPGAQAALKVYAQQSLMNLQMGRTGMGSSQYDSMFILMQQAANNPFIG